MKDGHKTCRNIHHNNWKWWFWKGSGTTYDPMWLQSLHWFKKSRREFKVSLVFLYLCTLSMAEIQKSWYEYALWAKFLMTFQVRLFGQFFLKSCFSEKATKIWKKFPLVQMLLSKNSCSCFVKTGGRFFQLLWPSHNVPTLKQKDCEIVNGKLLFVESSFSTWRKSLVFA